MFGADPLRPFMDWLEDTKDGWDNGSWPWWPRKFTPIISLLTPPCSRICCSLGTLLRWVRDNYYSISEVCLHAGCLAISLCAVNSGGCKVTVATLCLASAATYCALRPARHNMRLDEEIPSPAEPLQQRWTPPKYFDSFIFMLAFTSEHCRVVPVSLTRSQWKKIKSQ